MRASCVCSCRTAATLIPARAPPGPADGPVVPVAFDAAEGAVEPPATEAIHAARAWISFDESDPLNDGMIAPPSAIWSAIRLAAGRRRSRFGPPPPVEPAAASVWHPPQPAC